MIRVFICGAQSTGKTTLLNELLKEQDVDLHGENEVARKVIRDLGWQREDFDPAIHPDNFFELQLRVIQAQDQVEVENSNLNRSYVSDRGIDPLIYCKMYLGNEKLEELLKTKEGIDCIKRHKEANTVTVILQPHPECIEDDGVRLAPKIDDLHKFTDLMKKFLMDHAIAFTLISELDLRKRVSILKSLIVEARD